MIVGFRYSQGGEVLDGADFVPPQCFLVADREMGNEQEIIVDAHRLHTDLVEETAITLGFEVKGDVSEGRRQDTTGARLFAGH